MNSPAPRLLVTIDTECDKSATWQTANPLRFTGVTRAIPERLQPLFKRTGVRPTYLLSPEVMTDAQSCEVLRSVTDAELTTHLHGDYITPQIKTWTPAGTTTDEMQWEYPPDLERAKLAALTEMFHQQFDCAPTSFRAGRFGISPATGRFLRELGYLVDSSVTPHICWTSKNGVKRPDFRAFPERPYTVAPDGNIWTPGESDFLEVPVTILPAGTVPANNAREPIWFRPWYSDAATLANVLRHVAAEKPVNGICRPLVMMFHNVELIAGASPYPQNEAEVERYLQMMEDTFALAAKLGVQFCTLTEYYHHHMAALRANPAQPKKESLPTRIVPRTLSPAVPDLDLPVPTVEAALKKHNVAPWFDYAFRHRAERWDCWRPCEWVAGRFPKDAPVLSLGAGVGFNLFWLAQRGFTDLHGLDTDPAAIAAGREIATATGLPVNLWADDALKPASMPSKKFAVIEALVWVCLREEFPLEKLLDRYLPQLAPGGVFIVDIIDDAYNQSPNNEFHTQDWAKPASERRPSEYRHRLSELQIRKILQARGMSLTAKIHESTGTPKTVYVASRETPVVQPARLAPPSRKPRILVIADVPNWIFERHARTLHLFLRDEFDFTLGYKGEAYDESQFDLIYPLEFNLVDAGRIREPAKYVTGIRSHLTWQPLPFQPLAETLARNFQSVHVVSQRLQRIFQPVLPSVELLSHGVDTEFFTPATRADQSGKKLRLGWAGNRLSGSKKGFKEIIEPLGKLPGVELVFCGYSDRNLTLEQMREFYNSLDAYVCASDFEGNNNSLLEAAAMERAIITTDNGAVPEYLRHGHNALIVERALPEFIKAVEQLRDDPARRVRLGAAAREAVKTTFDWKLMAARHSEFFHRALKGRDRSQPIPTPKPTATKPPGYSFCIITNGKRPKKLADEIASIRALQIPQYEIIVGGDVPAGLEGVRPLSLPAAAKAGQLGEMRNRLTEVAKYDHLVVADDDMLFQPDFYQGLLEFGEDYEVLCVRLLNMDGTRFWDWATIGGPRGHRLMEYDETDAHVYVTGGLCIMKATVPERVKWDGQRGFYQAEDVDFSRRLQAADISIKFNPHSSVVHGDPRYTQVGAVIMTIEGLRHAALEWVDVCGLDEAREMLKYLRKLDPALADATEKEAPILTSPQLNFPVRWRGPFFNPSGYAAEAINFSLPLSRRVRMGIQHSSQNYSEKFVAGLKETERRRLFKLRDVYPRIAGGIVIEHCPAHGFSCVPDAVYRIGRTMFETDRILPGWISACNQMDEVWVPSKFNVETFASCGVERDKLRVIPESVDETEFDPTKHEPLPLPNRAAFNFLSIFEWSKRKGWDVLLAAYLREFSAKDDVCLYLRAYMFGKPDGEPRAAIEKQIVAHVATLNLGDKALPRIEILADQIPMSDLPRLYKAADCLVAPSRGEGWGRPHHEAMLMELPVIATNWSGNTEFMNRENSYLIDCTIVDTTALEPELWHYRNQRWAEPSEGSLRQAMRRVHQNRDEAKAVGQRARQHMVANYSRAVVADLIVARLHEIERKILTPSCPPATARAMEVSASEVDKKSPSLRVTWEGSFLDLGSLSHVNRELTAALSAGGNMQLTRVCQQESSVPVELQKLARRVQSDAPRQADVTVRHAWPPNWKQPVAGAWVLIQPWEFGVLPEAWLRSLAQVDEIWAPSEYVRRLYVESGVLPAKVKIVPNGIDPNHYRPGVEPLALATKKKFKFLFVGGTIHRKGPELLLKAYLESFRASDDVCLVIKDFGGQTVYRGQTLEKEIAAARLDPNAPEILYLTQEMPSAQMPALYAACQCLVHPYRGEGFGLPVLEAMACGLPVVVTGGGATDDFATDEYAWRLPARRMSIGDKVGQMKLIRNGWMLEPVHGALVERLRWVAAHPDEAQARGRAASEYVRREWTWERAARIARQRLHELTERKKIEVAAPAPAPVRKAAPIALPDCARIGVLAGASDLLAKKEFSTAWEATIAAINVRPHHPEAWLMLGKIAQAAGDGVSARKCVDRAVRLAPDWKPAKQFLKGIRQTQSKPAWLVLPPEPASARPRLSVCLIVKNEEKFLERCLQSVRGSAHQIVVVDTGSTDRTVEIAKKFDAEIHSFAWNDDFSAARNEALKYATGDWVLSLDADEELMPEHVKTILEEMQSSRVLGYRIPIFNVGQEKDGCGYVPRLFRNAPGLFFVGCIHEQIFSSLEVRSKEWGLEIALGRAALLHHGYTVEMVASRDKVARNLRLLQRAVEAMPGEPNFVMNLGLELIRSGQFEAGLEKYREAVRLTAAQPPGQVTPEFCESMLTQLTTNLLGAKRHHDIVELWQQPFPRSCAMSASQHFMFALALMEMRQHAAAAEHMRQCLAKRDKPALSPINKHILTAVPRHCLALSLNALGQHAEAGQALREALAEDPISRTIRSDLAKFEFQQGRGLEALKLVNALVAEDKQDLKVWQLGGQFALSQPEFLDFAQKWTGEALKNFPDDYPLLLLRAEALLVSQEFEQALPLWTRNHSPESPCHLAALTLCEVLTGNCRRKFAPSIEKLVSQEFLKWYRHLIRYKAASLVMQINERLEEFAPVLPSAVMLLGAAMKRAEAVAVA